MSTIRETGGIVGVKLTRNISDELYDYLNKKKYPADRIKYFPSCDGYGFIGSTFFYADVYGESPDERVVLTEKLFTNYEQDFNDLVKLFPNDMRKYTGFAKPMMISVWH